MKEVRSLSVALVAIALVACNGDDLATTQPPPPPALAGAATGLDGAFPPEFDPCDLISAEEAATAAGEPVREPESEISHHGIATCTFDPIDGFFPPVVLEVRPSDGAYDTAREIAAEMAASQDQMIETLSDVGDRAFYSVMLGHNIVVAAGGRFANLIVRQDPQADNREQAIDLARTVANRLR